MMRVLMFFCPRCFRLLLLLFFITTENIQADTSGGYEVRYLEDTENAIGVDSATLLLQQNEFTPHSGLDVNLGFSTSAYWIYVECPSNTNVRILVIENAHLDSVDFYQMKGRRVMSHLLSGDRVPFKNRYHDLNFFNIKVSKNTEYLLLKVKSEGLLMAPFKFFSEKEFYSYYSKNVGIHYFFFGILVLVFIVTLFLLASFREPIYFLYLLTAVSFFVMTSVDFGYLFQLIYPESPGINKYNIALYASHVFVIVFTKAYLNLYVRNKIINQLFNVVIAIYAFIFILSFFGDYSDAIRLITLQSFIIPILVIAILFYCYFTLRIKNSAYIFLGWLSHMLSIILYMFTVLSLLPYNIVTKNLLPLGATVEIVFFFIAFAHRINLLKKEKEELLINQNQTLEDMLELRTPEINDKNEMLSLQNAFLLKHKEELLAQSENLERQKVVIEKQNKQLNDLNIHLEDKVERKTQDLLKLTRSLEIKNNRLEHFAYVLSHNVRAPYASLRGLFNIFNRENLAAEENREIIGKVEKTLESMGEILKDASTLLQISIATDPEPKLTNISDTVKMAISKLAPEIEKKNAVVKNGIDENVTVKSIPSYLVAIFYHILENSLKFSKKREHPIVEISLNGDPKRKNFLLIKINNNGTGIDPTFLSHKLFKPFQKAHNDKSGKGMGLFIANALLEALHGNMQFESQLNVGTTVYLYLPK